MIAAAANRSRIDGVNHGSGLLWFEVGNGSMDCPFVSNRQDLAILSSTRDVVPQKMLNEAAEGSQTAVPCHSRVAPFRLDMVQEGEHRFRLNVVQLQVRDHLTLLGGQVLKEELQRIAVCANRVGAGPASGLQIAEEEALGQREQ
jgi:hypothetical protein